MLLISYGCSNNSTQCAILLLCVRWRGLTRAITPGLHKPDDQTALPAAQAASFLAPLPVRCLRGVGAAAEAALGALGVHTVAQLAATPRAAIARALGDRAAATLFEAARGPRAPKR